MKIELNESEVKHGIIMYLKDVCNIEAAAKDITFEGYGSHPAAWEKKEEDTDDE